VIFAEGERGVALEDFRCSRSGTVILPLPELETTLMPASGAAP
jgi:hypothetical protein